MQVMIYDPGQDLGSSLWNQDYVLGGTWWCHVLDHSGRVERTFMG